MKYKYNIQFYFTGTQYPIISVHEAAKILILPVGGINLV